MESDYFLGTAIERSGPDVRLAPMSGITDVVFRRLAHRFGASLVVTEMVAADAFLAGEEQAKLRSEGLGISPHVVQLVGRDPIRMGEAARLAEAAGAEIIDINFGCPAKRVTGGLGGSALMREPDLALRLVEAVVAAVAVPVTVKMRLGWDDAARNAADLARRAVGLGVSGVTVHGRTRQQFYTGRADWAAIREVVETVAVPVAANGDILCASTAATCLKRSGAAAVMIGRAALGQPWLIGQVADALARRPVRPISRTQKTAAAIEHYEGLLTLYGRRMAVKHARKHLAAYAEKAADEGFGLTTVERRELVTSTEPAHVIGLLRRLRSEPMRSAA